MTTVGKINKKIKELNIDGRIVRDRSGYYYFNRDLFDKVPSIWANNLNGYTTQDVILHVQKHYNN